MNTQKHASHVAAGTFVVWEFILFKYLEKKLNIMLDLFSFVFTRRCYEHDITITIWSISVSGIYSEDVTFGMEDGSGSRERDHLHF